MAGRLACDAVEAVQAAQATEKARRRIPEDTPKVITFYSERDEWLFNAVFDNRVCTLCLAHENKIYRGNELRNLFPEHVILDIEMIGGPGVGGDGLIHPNCRCRLERVAYWGDVGTEVKLET